LYILEFIACVFLTLTGLYALYLSYKNKKSIFWELPSGIYLSKKIFGKYFDRWHNFFWGTIFLVAGILIMVDLYKKIIN